MTETPVGGPEGIPLQPVTPQNQTPLARKPYAAV
jgi:hypothetical protein